MPRLQKLLLLCGLVATVVYVIANIVAGLSWPEYSFADQTISELSAIGAPSRGVWGAFAIPFGVLMLAFTIGLWLASAHEHRLRVVAAMLLAVAVLGPFWPPMHLRGETVTLGDTLHVVFAAVVSVLLMIAVATGARVAGRAFRVYSYATLAIMALLAIPTFLYAPRIALDQPTPGLGTIERILVGAPFAWLAVLSVVLARRATAGGHFVRKLTMKQAVTGVPLSR
jgi:hypothetical protein